MTIKKTVLIPVLSLFCLLACSKKENADTQDVGIEVDKNSQCVFKNVYFESDYWLVDTTTVERGAYKIMLQPSHSNADIESQIVLYIHDEILDVPTYMNSLKQQVSGRKSLSEYATFTEVMRTQPKDGIEISESIFPIMREDITPQYKGYIRIYSDKANKRTYGLFVVGNYYYIDNEIHKNIVNSFSFGKPKAKE